MEGPRQPTAAEFPRLLDFLQTELRPSVAWQIAQEYPNALNSNNLHNIRILSDGTEFLSHAVLKPLIVKTPRAIIKAAAIGSVVTSTAHRGQGYSAKVIQDCLLEAKEQVCDIAILWTNLYDFYRKFDFELAGSERSALIDAQLPPTDTTYRMITGPQVSAEAIQRIYSQHTVNTPRTSDEIRKFLQIPNSRIYTAWDRTNQLVGYAVEGKGADLTDYIHEWGGSVTAIMFLLREIQKEKKAAFRIMIPQHSTNLILKLKELGVEFHNGYLGMIKILNYENLFAKIKRAFHAEGETEFVLEKVDPTDSENSSGWHFGIGNDRIQVTDPKDLVSLLFGPYSDVPHLTEQTQSRLRKILPLPFWIWGWDSI